MMASLDAPALLGFVAGVSGTIAAFGAKYAFDFRLAKRRLELDERAAIATTIGGRPGQLRRSTVRLKDRVDGMFRDAQHMPSWLSPGPEPTDDGYFLRSTVHRVFMHLSWASLMQQALEALPTETLRARADLQRQYALLDLSGQVLTSIGLFPGFAGYATDRDGYHLFTGTVDELADLGVAAFNRNSQVIPIAEFDHAYDNGEPCLMRLRAWISDMCSNDPRSSVIKARFACLGAVLTEITSPSPGSNFGDKTVLRARLASLSTPAVAYDFESQLPPWLDAQLAGAMRQWH